MDRIIVGLGILGAICTVPASLAGGVQDVYPESRFGQPPAKIDTGVNTHYAMRAVEDLEADEAEHPAVDPISGASRAPAGMSYDDDGSGKAKPSRKTKTANRAAPAPEVAQKPPTVPLPNLDSAPLSSESTTMIGKGVQEVALIAGDLGFFPKTVFVTRDIPVRMFVTGASKNTLCIMMDTFQVRKQVRSQRIEEITFTPTMPGRYRFYCPVNGTEGMMIVKEFATGMVQAQAPGAE